MKVMKYLGAILLAIYLILVGLGGFVSIPVSLLHILALVSGVMILVSLGMCCRCHERCNKEDKL